MSDQKTSSYLLNTASRDKWLKLGSGKRAGVLVPLFSVYSRDSLGIGDLSDLRLIIDWSERTGNSVVQLLPMNEMGGNFCPYDALSSFALEPAYLSLQSIPCRNKNSLKTKINELRNKFSPGESYVNYQIKKEKIKLLWDIFQEDNIGLNRELESFISENHYWLDDFALYKVLKDYYDGKPWYEWDERYKNRDAVSLQAFFKGREREAFFQIWLQWLVSQQFKDVKKYALSRRVLIKGDLPVLVSRDSADVWAHPEFFKLEFAAGAPPDMYCAKGQRWGMPPYNWEKISADSYRYLKEKLKYAQDFYDILRIDHVVGLFRIWSIPYNEPKENQGLNGFFDPADENKWEEHGRNILLAMHKGTNMLLCAEDLGVIPKACPKVLEEIGIPGNDVQRWTKDWRIRHDFLTPREYRLLSVSMLSTHDTTNWAAWWENEAGTVDEGLFMRKCAERGIDFLRVKNELFDLILSCHGRLRWLNKINSVDVFKYILGKNKEEVADLIDMYENTYQEKEKLWKHLGLVGPMREKPDPEIARAALKENLESNSLFCVNLLTDWLYLAGIFKGDPYQYRINTPGTISDRNWSLVFPIPLEDLLRHRVNGEIKKMLTASGRI